jgi:hypothetical protein
MTAARLWKFHATNEPKSATTIAWHAFNSSRVTEKLDGPASEVHEISDQISKTGVRWCEQSRKSDVIEPRFITSNHQHSDESCRSVKR